MALDKLKVFEGDADREIAKVGVWTQPIRNVLSWAYLSADAQYTGGRFFRNRKVDDEVGTALLSRLSYVIKYFASCSRLIGANIDDALSVVNEQFQDDLKQTLSYAHFCEIMPLVHRGFLHVAHDEGFFRLSHPSESFRKHEELDILMSELVLAHDLVRPPFAFERYKRMMKTWPQIRGDDFITVLRELFDHYMQNVFEMPLLGDSGFQEGFGFSRSDFTRTRAALMAYADFCLGMANASEILSLRAVTRPKRERLQREVREWAAPLLKRNHVIGTAAWVSDVDPKIVERICSVFTIDLDHLAQCGGGEGFYPPFLLLEDSLLFSPHAVKRMMPERNLLYSLRRTDQKKFDEFVSAHLEPALINDAAEVLSRLPDVEIQKNVTWQHGEIDLLALHYRSNTAFQIQAKAALPPQGARMIAQIESRTREGADQIARFLDLDGSDRDDICSRAFGKKLKSLSWRSGILVRSCFGTERAWKAINGLTPLNPILLREAVRLSMSVEDVLNGLVDISLKSLEKLRETAVRGWEPKNITLFETKIELPLLDLDYTAIGDFRNTATSAGSASGFACIETN